MSLEQAEEQIQNKVASHATKSEKMSWERKYRNMKKFLKELDPIESQIIELMTEKQFLIDRITVTRDQMVDTCIHPKKELEIHEGEVSCKFCNRRFGIPDEPEA